MHFFQPICRLPYPQNMFDQILLGSAKQIPGFREKRGVFCRKNALQVCRQLNEPILAVLKGFQHAGGKYCVLLCFVVFEDDLRLCLGTANIPVTNKAYQRSYIIGHRYHPFRSALFR